MTRGKHRKHRRQRPTLVQVTGPSPTRRIVFSALGVVGVLGALTGLAAAGVSAPDAQAQGLDKPAQIKPVPIVPLPIVTSPRKTDEQHDLVAGTNEKFLAAVNAAGIRTAGREDELLMIAKRGADAHTTDADLEQSLRALFPDIDEKHADAFAYQVRQAWPGAHDQDTDDDGR